VQEWTSRDHRQRPRNHPFCAISDAKDGDLLPPFLALPRSVPYVASPLDRSSPRIGHYHRMRRKGVVQKHPLIFPFPL
ncbi:hypothetical protein PENTCL1PPCAC_24049, partial [Pristionchus entomophagus]